MQPARQTKTRTAVAAGRFVPKSPTISTDHECHAASQLDGCRFLSGVYNHRQVLCLLPVPVGQENNHGMPNAMDRGDTCSLPPPGRHAYRQQRHQQQRCIGKEDKGHTTGPCFRSSRVQGVMLEVQARQAPQGLESVHGLERGDQVAAHLERNKQNAKTPMTNRMHQQSRL